MEILQYTDEHRMFRDSLRRFLAKEITPHVEEWEEAGIVPREAWKKMGEQGFLAMSVPEEYGGLGADFLYSVIVTEEMIRTNHSGLAASLHTDIIVPYIVSFATEEQKHKYLPGCISGDIITAIAMTEPNTGSDLAAIKTTADESGDDVIINGQKTFISNGINCDLLVLAARDPGEENPHAAVDLYLVEAIIPGFEKGKRIKKVGWHSQDTAELYFTDCRIPKANRLGENQLRDAEDAAALGISTFVSSNPKMRSDAAMAAQHLFFAIIKINMRGEQGITHCHKRRVQSLDRLLLFPARAAMEPCAFYGMDDQKVAHFRAPGHDRMDARKVILDLGVEFPPGRLVENTRGIITLCLAQHGVPRKVLAAQVDAQRGLPVAERLVAGERKVPAGAAVRFRQSPLPAELAGDGTQLLGGVIKPPVLGQ